MQKSSTDYKGFYDRSSEIILILSIFLLQTYEIIVIKLIW